MVNNNSPKKPVSTPTILLVCILLLKNRIPITTTQIGVSELSIPASDPSIRVRASAKRNAGRRLPNTAPNITTPILLRGIFLKKKMAKGTNTNPAENIRKPAICAALSATVLSRINLKELPQIKHKATKISQQTNLLLIDTSPLRVRDRKCAKVKKQDHSPGNFFGPGPDVVYCVLIV
jgi:hypothetical protein